jgi:hypothetical protein
MEVAMSRKRTAVLRLLLLACVVAGGVAYLCWDDVFPPPPGVNPRNFARLRVGMTRAEVHGILGGGPQGITWFSSCFFDDWRDDGYTCRVSVSYSPDGKVTDGRCHVGDGDELSSLTDRDFLGRLRRWCGL